MPFRFVNLPRVAVLEVVRWCRWWPAGAGAVHFRRILQEIRPPPGRSVRIIMYNHNGTVIFCKFAFILQFFDVFSARRSPWRWSSSAVGSSRAWDRVARRRCRAPSVRRSARNIGRRATLLPSPRRCSFLPFMVSGWWSPFCSGVLLLRVSRWCLCCSFLFRWVWLYTGYILSLFNRARNKRARTREGWRRSFPLLCPLRGCWRRFSLGVGVGHPLNAWKAWRGVSVRFLYFRWHCQKSTRAQKLAPLGRFWSRPGGAGFGFFGCLFWVRR